MSLDTARRVLRIEAQAIQDVLRRLDATFEKAVDVLFQCKGRVVVTGMGKSGLIGRKISATLSSTGTPSFFLHPAEALTQMASLEQRRTHGRAPLSRLSGWMRVSRQAERCAITGVAGA